MILHYLGLDHIGHFAGPTSALMPLKQREMDSVLQKLYTSAESLLTNNGTRTLIVLVGDHGMNEVSIKPLCANKKQTNKLVTKRLETTVVHLQWKPVRHYYLPVHH